MIEQDFGVRRRQRPVGQRLQGLDQQLMLRLPGSGACIHGTMAGITETGALRVATAEGLRTFHAGDVTSHHP